MRSTGSSSSASSTSRRNSRPTTAAGVRTCSAVSPSRARRVWISSLMPSGTGTRLSVESLSSSSSGASSVRLAQRLLDEERVALGPLLQAQDERARGLACLAGLDELHRLGVVEPVERDPLEAGVAVEPREQLGDLLGAVAAGLADRRHDEQPHRLDVLQHVPEQQRGRGVRPLQVVEHEHRRRLAGHTREHAGDGFEEPEAARLAVLGERVPQLGQMAAQRGDEAGELGQLGLELGRQRQRLAVRHVVLHGGHKGLVGHERFGVAAAVEHGRAGRVRLPGEL